MWGIKMIIVDLNFIKFPNYLYNMETKVMKLPEDIEPLFGLWVIFELPKCSKEEQNRVMSKIEKGNYPKK